MVYKILLIALITFVTTIKSDVLLVLILFLTLLLLLFYNPKIKAQLLEVILILLAIFFTAFISTFFEDNILYNIIRDSWYLLKPVLIIFAAYFIISKIQDKLFLFKAIIYVGIFTAIIHLINVLPIVIEGGRRISELRGSSGRGNILEVFSLTFLFFNRENRFFKSKYLKYAVYALLILSVLLYFSRTMLLLVFVISFSMKGYLKITNRSLRYIAVSLISIISIFAYINTLDLSADSPGINGFLYKVKIAPSEIFETEIDINDPRDLWDHFRAYEAIKAIELSKKEGIRAVIFGNGLGSLVDLDLKVKLSGEELQYIPIIHNGYVFIFFKAGLVGLFLYLLLLLKLYLNIYHSNLNDKYIFTRRLLSTIGIYYLLTSFVITGIYNPSDICLILLGGALFLESYFKKLEKVK